MEPTSDFIQAIHDVVLRPDFTSAVVLFGISLVNELFALLPYHAILSGQLLFLNDPPSVLLFTKLLLFVALPVSVGSTIGSLLTYGVAFFGGKPAIMKFGRYVRLSWENVEKVEKKLSGFWYDELVFLFLRSIPLLPSLPVNVAAGVVRMRIFPYIVFTFAGTIIKVMSLFGLIALGIISVAQ